MLELPGLGTFRAPARYTLLTSLVLVLLAGRGLDRSIAPRRFWGGLAVAIVVGAAAWGWSIYWAQGPDFRAGLGADTIGARFAAAGLAWGLGLLAIVGWRLGRLGAWAPVTVAVLELGALLFVGPAWWGWRARLPESSPVLRRLAELPDVGLVGGRLLNIPVDAGLTTAYPNLGITPPPPNYLIESAMHPPGEVSDIDHRWQARFGVTHGVWGAGDDVLGVDVLAVIPDPALDRVIGSVPHLRARGPWKLVHDPSAFPPAWVARRIMKDEELGRTLRHPVDRRLQGRGLVPPRGRGARVAGTGRSVNPRPGLGRSHGDRRARRLLRLDPAADLLPRLVLSDRRRPPAAGAQGQRRPPRRPTPRGRHQPRRAAIPADRIDPSRDRHARRPRRRLARRGQWPVVGGPKRPSVTFPVSRSRDHAASTASYTFPCCLNQSTSPSRARSSTSRSNCTVSDS